MREALATEVFSGSVAVSREIVQYSALALN